MTVRPQDLKHPFSWEKRHVCLQDRVLYVPDRCDHYDTFAFPGWTSDELFGNDHPVFVEYCSGNGSWIVNKAEQNPEKNWVAVEKKFERVRKIWAKLKKRQINNLFVICGEGSRVTSCYFPPASVDQVFINFPDPWPKTRHFKHRIIRSSFIVELEKVLKEKGELTFVTDDFAYSQEMQRVMQLHPLFVSLHSDPYYSTHFEGYGTSFFEELWRKEGKEIRYHQYCKEG